MPRPQALGICLIIVVFLPPQPLVASGPPPVFVDVTEETGIEFVFPGEEIEGTGDGDYGGGGMAAADFDGDGDLDLILAGGYGFPLVYLRNDGQWQFSPHSGGEALVDYGWEKGLTAADYDNDGDKDLFVAVADGPQQLLANSGNGSFTNVTEDCTGIT